MSRWQISTVSSFEYQSVSIGGLTDRSQPAAVGAVTGRAWPTADEPHQLTACPKPDAQGADPKVSLAVIRSQVARPGFGQEQSSAADSRVMASG